MIINDINTPDITVNDGSDHDNDLGNMSLEVAFVELKNSPDNCLKNGMKELGTTSENVGTGEVNDPHDPHLINDISSPYVSTPTVLSWKPADTRKSDKGNLSFFRNTLQNAGYTPSEVDDAILAYIDKQKTCNHAAYDKNRPQTHIFSHGKVYTYEKLDTVVSTAMKKSKPRTERLEMSVTKENENECRLARSHLNPQAAPFTPRIDHCAFTNLKNIRANNMKNVIIGQLNINSLRNKFHSLVEIIHGNLDILVITETKLDHTFPEKQFLIPGYRKPYRKDRNRNGGGVMIYVREDIPCDILIKHNIPTNIEAIFLEINL